MKTCLLVNKFLINDDNLVIEKENKKIYLKKEQQV